MSMILRLTRAHLFALDLEMNKGEYSIFSNSDCPLNYLSIVDSNANHLGKGRSVVMSLAER